MQYLCQNGIDYENCEITVDKEGEVCDNCNEIAYENYLSDFYGGSQPVTLKEKQRKIALDTIKKLWDNKYRLKQRR